MMRCFSSALIVLAAFVGGANAFVIPSQTGAARISTELYGNTKIAPTLPPIKDISYGEESRQYRRTVYTHDDWRKHRSPDRFLYYIQSLFVSGVYKNIGRELAIVTSVSAFIVLYNAVVGGYTDFEGVEHAALVASDWLPKAGLPLVPFTLSSPSLGLLLGTRSLF